MFEREPNVESQLDELDRAIESHRIQSKQLYNELENYANEIRGFKEKNLRRPLLRAINGYKSIKERIEVIEDTRMRLVEVRTHLKYTPDTLNEKSFTAVNKLIRDSELKLSRNERYLTQLSDLTSVSSLPESEIELSETEINSLLSEIGIEEEIIQEPEGIQESETVYGGMPEIPEELLDEAKKEEKEKPKVQEEKA
jgi:hypothetical protein